MSNCESNKTKLETLDNRVTKLEVKQDKLESLINNIDKTLQVSLERVQNIAEDLKTTSVNFKEAIMRSNTAQTKEIEQLKDKNDVLEKKLEKLDIKVEQETIVKDAEKWKKITSYVTTAILGAIVTFILAKIGLGG